MSSAATGAGSVGLREQSATLPFQFAKIQRASGPTGLALVPKPAKRPEVFALQLALHLPIAHRLTHDFAGGCVFTRVYGRSKRRDLFRGQRNADFLDVGHSGLQVANYTTYYYPGK